MGEVTGICSGLPYGQAAHTACERHVCNGKALLFTSLENSLNSLLLEHSYFLGLKIGSFIL